jgi:DNA-directed RNA polymerase specialized sigma24 family protein
MDSITDQRDQPKKNFGLTAEAFEVHLQLLKSGDEKLFEIIFKSHFNTCRSYLIREMNADEDVAYDIVLDTLVKFRRNLIADKIKYGNMAGLFTIDARNTYLRSLEKSKKREYLPVESQEDELAEQMDDGEIDLETINNLRNALQKIGNDCYELLNWHYYLKLPLKTIADNREARGDQKFINEASVKTKIAECRKKLKSLLS